MAIYICDEYSELTDNDYHHCEEHPTVDNGLICPDCMDEMEGE